MADALLVFWQQQLAIYQAEQKAAQDDLAKAQASLQTANAQSATDQKAFDKAGSDISAARAKLAITTVPADANALITQITQMIIAQRGLQGAVLDDQDQLADLQASLDSSAATLARASARVASAEASIATVQAEASKRDMYRAAVAAPPLATLKADSAAFLASATVTHATTRLGKNFPDKLLAIAHKRHDTRVNHVKSLRTDLANSSDALATEQATDSGLVGAACQKQIAFQRAQNTLTRYVATAANGYTKAKAVMAALEAIELDASGTVPDVLTDAEKAQLTALTTAGATAEGTAETLDADLNGVFTAEAALQSQILASIAANVDALGTDPNITTKRTAIETARTTFKNALSTFAAADKKDLDQWEAVVPEAAWKVLLDYQEATATLNELSTSDPAALSTAMDTAETDYVTALGAAAVAQRRIDYLGDAIALRQERLESAQAAIAARLFSAIRGDSY
jgi:hypothetical protein